MPSAAQKQRRRKLKQKKEQKKGQNDDRIEPYVRRRIRRATESLSSNYGTSDRLIRLLEDALAAAARERPAQMPLNEEDVKLSMMAQARRASRNAHDEAVLIYGIPEPPDALVCPISMELMEDPVLAMDGHTYDRSSIEAWLKTGKKTSPKTNEALPSTTLYPNHAVKSMVQDYLETCKKHHC